MYYSDESLILFFILGLVVLCSTFSAIFATIDYAIRGKSWSLSFGRTLLTTSTFIIFLIIVSIMFGDELLYW